MAWLGLLLQPLQAAMAVQVHTVVVPYCDAGAHAAADAGASQGLAHGRIELRFAALHPLACVQGALAGLPDSSLSFQAPRGDQHPTRECAPTPWGRHAFRLALARAPPFTRASS